MHKFTLEEVKNKLNRFANNFHEIPESFIVHPNFLENLNEADFIKAFKDYRDLIKEIYLDASINPYHYGITSIDKETKIEKSANDFNIYFIFYFINKICFSSILIDDKLVVNLEDFNKQLNEFPKMKKVDKLFNKFKNFGFIFEGYNGLSKTKDLVVKNKIKNVITVMKSYSTSKFSNVGIEYDYSHFNYKLLTIGKDKNLPLQDLYVFNKLSEESQDFLISFNSEMNKHGYFYGDCPTSGFCWGISQFAYSKNPEKKKDYVCRLYQRNDTLVIRLFLNNIDRYSAYIEDSPEYIKDSFINEFGRCDHCKEECHHRKTYTIGGVQYNKCNGLTFEFYNLEISSIPYYIELIKLSNTK